MRVYKLISTVLITLFVYLNFSQAQGLPQGVSIYRLDNGMQVLLIENPALPMVGVNVVVKVGSAYENVATSGMSHMLEHLLFNGTTGRTQKQLYDDVDRIGGYNNANTSTYFTNFMMVTPAENIRKGMEIQADMLFHSTLPEAKFAKEKGIVLEEISKSLADPDEQKERNILSVLYKGHALSLPTLGTYSTIEHMDRDAVYDFYLNNYVPNNMLMSVIGNFDTKAMLQTIKEIYGTTAPGRVERDTDPAWSEGFDRTYWVAPQGGSVFHRFYDGKNDALQLFFPIPSGGSSAFYELLDLKLADLIKPLEHILQKMFPETIKTIRLQTRTNPLSAYVQVNLNLQKAVNTQNLSETVRKFLAQQDWSFDATRLEAESAKARTAFLKNIEKPHMFGIFNAHLFAEGGIETVLASYGAETFVQAAQALSKLTVSGKPVVLFQHPRPVSRTEQAGSAGVETLFKSNGKNATLIVKQNPASHLLAIHYLIGHKAPLEAQYGKDAAKLLHAAFGLRMKSKKLRAKISALGITLKVNDNPFFPMDDIYMNPDFGYIRVEALAESMDKTIALLNTEMLNFIPTQKEYQQAVAQSKRMNPMMMGGGNPAKDLFKRSYKSLIYKDNPFPAKKGTPSYKELVAFAKTYFIPANMVISVVSPETPKQVQQQFSAFTGTESTINVPVYSRKLRLQQTPKQVTKSGDGNRAYLFWGFSKKIDTADKAALKALSLLLGDKIIFDIREKQGMAYHLSAGIQLDDDRALFYIEQGTRPQNVEKLTPQYPGFFDIHMLSDLTAADLEKAVNMYLGRMMFRRLSSINQGYYLGTSYYFHNDITYDRHFLQALKQVKFQDVQRVAEKYMHVENPVSVIVK